MTDLCRCGHLIQKHRITTGLTRRGLGFRREECVIHETGLFDKCDCSKVRSIDKLGYLEQQYEHAIRFRQEKT